MWVEGEVFEVAEEEAGDEAGVAMVVHSQTYDWLGRRRREAALLRRGLVVE